MDLSKARHAFITGGASGIGLGIAGALAKHGIAVSLADIDKPALDAVLAERGQGFGAIVLDTRDRAGWQAAKHSAEAAFGPVDILVNNAGIAPDGREFADMDPASFDRIVAINLFGVFNGVSTFAADLRARRHGHIVNTSSMAGLTTGFPGMGAYSVAKFGVVAMSEVLRKEMAPHGVGVSALCPGLVATNLPQTTLKLGGSVRDPNATMGSTAVTAAMVGEMVAKGIAEDQAYIITHPETWPRVEERTNTLRDAYKAAG